MHIAIICTIIITDGATPSRIIIHVDSYIGGDYRGKHLF